MREKLEDNIYTAIEDHREAMVSFLQRLVQQPSVLGNERGAQEIVYHKLKSLGFSTEIWEPRLDVLASHPAFAPVEWDYNGRPNVTGVLQGNGGGKSLAFNGHVDVVSPEPLWGWSYDPWGAEIVGNRMYGRGAGDMKCGIAMVFLALEALKETGVRLRGNVYMETVIEEECGGNGALACRLKGHASSADAALVVEPTNLATGIGELGVIWFRVRARSLSGHVAQAHKSGNVIESCFPLMRALRGLEAELNQQINHPYFRDIEHPVNLNIGTIQGGQWPSSVPVECSFVCRLSYEPGITNLEIRQRIEACIYEAAAQDALFKNMPPVIEYYGFQSLASTIDRDHELLSALGQAHRHITGEEIQKFAFTGTTDARSFNLYSETPATAYGPVVGNIHNADEYVELDSIVTGAKTTALFMMNWCGVEE